MLKLLILISVDPLSWQSTETNAFLARDGVCLIGNGDSFMRGPKDELNFLFFVISRVFLAHSSETVLLLFTRSFW